MRRWSTLSAKAPQVWWSMVSGLCLIWTLAAQPEVGNLCAYFLSLFLPIRPGFWCNGGGFWGPIWLPSCKHSWYWKCLVARPIRTKDGQKQLACLSWSLPNPHPGWSDMASKWQNWVARSVWLQSPCAFILSFDTLEEILPNSVLEDCLPHCSINTLRTGSERVILYWPLPHLTPARVSGFWSRLTIGSGSMGYKGGTRWFVMCSM